MSQAIDPEVLEAFLHRRGCNDEAAYMSVLILQGPAADLEPVDYTKDAATCFPFGYAQLPLSLRDALEDLVHEKGDSFLGADRAPMRATREALRGGDYSAIFKELIGFAGEAIADPFLTEFYRQQAVTLAHLPHA